VTDSLTLMCIRLHSVQRAVVVSVVSVVVVVVVVVVVAHVADGMVVLY
jgi:hypothetical protein